MITQGVLDFFRDIFYFWLQGMNSLIPGDSATAVGSATGGALDAGSHVLALVVAGSLWPAVVTLFGAYVAVFVVTGLVAVIGRRSAG